MESHKVCVSVLDSACLQQQKNGRTEMRRGMSYINTGNERDKKVL